MPIANPSVLLAKLPNEPGVYCFLGRGDRPLYVGKAAAIKKRVASYFGKTNISPRIRLMLHEATRLETTITADEGEALLLENTLIKSLKPRYNILFRDDKSYPYLQITQHPYPRITFVRLDKADKNKSKNGKSKTAKPSGKEAKGARARGDLFGPYPNSEAVRETIDILQRTFLLRTCADSVFASRDRPCLLHSIRRCSAPCTNRISPDEYAAATGQARDLMTNGASAVVAALQDEMTRAAAAQQYERAAVLRDRLAALAVVRRRHFVDDHDSTVNADYIGIAYDGQRACVNVLVVRGGRRIGEKKWYPQNVREVSADSIAEAFLLHHYPLGKDGDDANSTAVAPSTIYLNATPAATRSIASAWASWAPADKAPRFVYQPKGEQAARLSSVQKNAELALSLHNTQSTIRQARLARLAERLHLPHPPRTMECFDISHSSGEETVAAKVAFTAGAPDRKQYRLYRIKKSQQDDYAAIGEAVRRRFDRWGKEEQPAGTPLPDIVFIDGGVGQLAAAMDAVTAAGVSPPPLLFAVAKGAARQVGQETIHATDGEIFRFSPTDEALHLIQAIRDEAHRFAVRGHRRRRDKKRARTTALDGIDGLGEKKKNEVMRYFGGLATLKSASAAELAKAPGIGPALAARIYHHLH